MISAKLNKVIEIEKGISGVSSMNSPIFDWQYYMRTYANVVVPSSDARLNTDNEEYLSTTEFIIRYNSATKILNNKYRILYNDTYYKIISISEIGVKEGFKITAIYFSNGN